MAKLLAGIIAGVFVLGSTAVFAYKLEPMDKEQRTELRERADRLVAERDRDSHRMGERDSHRMGDRDSHRMGLRDRMHNMKNRLTHKSSSETSERESSSGR